MVTVFCVCKCNAEPEVYAVNVIIKAVGIDKSNIPVLQCCDRVIIIISNLLAYHHMNIKHDHKLV